MAQAPRRRRWSAKVNRTSDALDLEQDPLKSNDPKAIADSLKRSAEHRKTLGKAKDELRRDFGR